MQSRYEPPRRARGRVGVFVLLEHSLLLRAASESAQRTVGGKHSKTIRPRVYLILREMKVAKKGLVFLPRKDANSREWLQRGTVLHFE